MKTVRDGRKVSPYCSKCGCRLQKRADIFGIYGYQHYNAWATTDARGCYCPVVREVFWTSKGKVYGG